MNDPFPIGETPGRPFIRPHRLAQLVPGSYAHDETIRDIRRRLNRPRRSIGLDVLLLTLLGILGWGLLLVGLYAWLGGAL